MAWVEIFAVFVVSHALGDYLLQTDWQATHKRGGLGRDSEARRALLLHVTTYTLAFVPALIWIGDQLDPGWAIWMLTRPRAPASGSGPGGGPPWRSGSRP